MVSPLTRLVLELVMRGHGIAGLFDVPGLAGMTWDGSVAAAVERTFVPPMLFFRVREFRFSRGSGSITSMVAGIGVLLLVCRW